MYAAEHTRVRREVEREQRRRTRWGRAQMSVTRSKLRHTRRVNSSKSKLKQSTGTGMNANNIRNLHHWKRETNDI